MVSETKLHSEGKRININIELSVLPPRGHQYFFTRSTRGHFIMKLLALIVLGIVSACCVAAPARHTKVLRSDSDSSDVSQSSDDTSGSGSSSSSEDSSSGTSSEDSSDDNSGGARQANLAGNPAMVGTDPTVRTGPVFVDNDLPGITQSANIDPPTVRPFGGDFLPGR